MASTTDEVVEIVARKMAQHQGFDPDVMVAAIRGAAIQVAEYNVIRGPLVPTWKLFSNGAREAIGILSEAGLLELAQGPKGEKDRG